MLADIAHELDEVERQLMISNGTDTPEALNFIAQVRKKNYPPPKATQ